MFLPLEDESPNKKKPNSEKSSEKIKDFFDKKFAKCGKKRIHIRE